MKNKQHSLWVEKYRPVKLEDYISGDVLKMQLGKYIKNKDIPDLLFYGPSGIGKTTVAKLLVKNIDCAYIYINCSDENGIDTVRDKIKNFISSASFKPLKIVICDEADFLSAEAQAALRALIEEYSLNSRFIFTCNYKDKIIPAILSRCVKYASEPPSKKEVAMRLASIFDQEEISYELPDIKTLIDRVYPDIRECISTAQECITEDNKFDVNLFYSNDTGYLKKILAVLKKPGNNSWKEIRQIILDADINDYTEVFKFLYNTAEEFSKDRYAEVIIQISQSQYQQYFSADREINSAEMFLKILKIIK